MKNFTKSARKLDHKEIAAVVVNNVINAAAVVDIGLRTTKAAVILEEEGISELEVRGKKYEVRSAYPFFNLLKF